MLDVSCAGHITADDGVLETAVKELEEELGLKMTIRELEAARICTLPSSMCGETSFGPFVCREYQELFVVRCDEGFALTDLSLGSDEVAAVEWVAANEVLEAWASRDPNYVPREAPYRAVIADALQLDS